MIENKKEIAPSEQVADKDMQSPQITNQAQTKGNQREVRYSGFWVRGAAFILDSLIVAVITVVLIFPVSMLLGILSAVIGPIGFIAQFLTGFVGMLIAWGYFIFMTHKFQATLGKMAIGVQVFDENGEKLSFGSIILREIVGKFVSGFLFGIGYIMAAFTGKKQGLHDIISKSVVTYKNPVGGPNTIVVVTTYVLYSIFMSVIVLLFAGLFVIIGLLITSETGGSDGFDIGEILWNNGLEEIIGEMTGDTIEFDVNNFDSHEIKDVFTEDKLQTEMDEA